MWEGVGGGASAGRPSDRWLWLPRPTTHDPRPKPNRTEQKSTPHAPEPNRTNKTKQKSTAPNRTKIHTDSDSDTDTETSRHRDIGTDTDTDTPRHWQAARLVLERREIEETERLVAIGGYTGPADSDDAGGQWHGATEQRRAAGFRCRFHQCAGVGR